MKLVLATLLVTAAATQTAYGQTAPSTPATPIAATVPSNIPPLSVSPFIAPSIVPPHRSFVAPAPKVRMMPQNLAGGSQTCLAMRSYNYTPDANSPQLKDATTCTPAKPGGMRSAVAPATR